MPKAEALGFYWALWHTYYLPKSSNEAKFLPWKARKLDQLGILVQKRKSFDGKWIIFSIWPITNLKHWLENFVYLFAQSFNNFPKNDIFNFFAKRLGWMRYISQKSIVKNSIKRAIFCGRGFERGTPFFSQPWAPLL